MRERTIGQNVKTYRQARGLTQQELAGRATTCVGTISAIERGRTNVNRHTLTRVARALGVKIKQLESESQANVEAA